MSTDTNVTPEELIAHAAWLQRLAVRLCDPSTAEDMVQETWAAAVRARPGRDQPLRPWLAEVLRNMVRMRRRSQVRFQARVPALAADAGAPLPSPEELLGYHEAQRLVAEAVAQLEEPYRSTVLLCYAQEIAPAEIARRQGIPGGTVRWRLKRGLDELRAKLDERHGRDRKAWYAALAPLTTGAGGGAAVVAGGGAGAVGAGGGALAGVGWKLGAAAAAVAVVAGAVLAIARGTGGGEVALRDPGAASVTARAAGAGNRSWGPAGVPRLVAAAGGPGAAGPGGPGGPAPAATPAAAAAAASPEREEALRRASDPALLPADTPVRGNPKAPVTIIVWSEFQCPFCARVVPTLVELEKSYPDKVRIAWRHLPLAFHESAQLASEAALAAGEQGKFWAMHDRLFAQPERLDPAALEEHARALGLDVPRWRAALDSGKYRARVEADGQLGKDAGVTGAPTFFINGERLTGAMPAHAFKHRVEVALAKLEGRPPPAAPAQPPGGLVAGARPVKVNTFWPPPALTLPDALLGPRLPVRFATARAPMRGAARAPVEVLYFTSLGCPDCARASLVLKGLLASYGEHLRVYAKVVPVVHAQEPPLVAEAALYAHGQGKFWELHDGFGPSDGRQPDAAALAKLGAGVGLDAADLRAALDEGRFRAAALDEAEALRAAGIRSTGFAVDGRLADGSVALVQLVETAIRKAGRRTPPRPQQTIEANPRAPGYQPQLLMMYMSAKQLYANEPRDDAWAGAVEKEMSPLVSRDLRGIDPKLAGAELQCRTTMCRLSWRASRGNEAAVAAAARYLYAGAGAIGQPDAIYLPLRNPARPGPLPVAEAVAALKARRNTQIYNQRTGRANAALPFPADRLPRE
jgi:RNA polymerase sigma factor (sigma-70 family)